MQMASREYKDLMKRKYRDTLSHMRVTIGVINQQAQASAYVPNPDSYAYYGNLKMPLDNYVVAELYAVCDQNYTAVDGSMYFLPRLREDVVLNQGIVTDGISDSIEIAFPIPYDIKGLTIEFGRAYPIDFQIESDSGTVEITGNAAGHFVTEEIFKGATYLRFTPVSMSNGRGRFRINQITMGMGIYFDNKKILAAAKFEHVNQIVAELPAIDFSLTVNNKDRAFDIENEESTVNFLEIGQTIEVLYGQAMDNGSIEWMPGATLRLKEWSADDEEMSFVATDRFDGMGGVFYGGRYREEGVSLYDLAVEVFTDAGVDHREYWIDPYLRDVRVNNPVPAVSHKAALQMIANAGRCVLYQDRSGKVFIKSSFIPEMTSASENESYFSHADRVLDKMEKTAYAMTAAEYTDVQPTQYFLPREHEGILNVGYISEDIANGAGAFAASPTLSITLEAAFKCFGLTLEFGHNHPEAMVFHAYYNGRLMEDYGVSGLSEVTVVSHEFPEFDRLVLEFVKGVPHNRVVLNNIAFGDNTDYVLEYGVELTKTPKGTQLTKVRELQVIRTLYGLRAEEAKELTKETINVTAADNRHTFYFSNPSYEHAVTITAAQGGQGAEIIESSAYYATVELTGATGETEVTISGKEYVVAQAKVSRQINPTGRVEKWENPLVSDTVHAVNLADWIGDFMYADREYDLQYRGEPRLDANDIVFLENKYIPNLLLRVYEHNLKFNGAFSGTIKARRDMGNVAAAQNRLEGQ